MSILSPLFWQASWVLISIAIFLIGAFFGAGKLLIRQFEQRLDERFKSLEHSRSESSRIWTESFHDLKRAAANNENEWRRVEREMMSLKAEIPIHYVRREDYIRNQSIIEAKIDGVAIRIENALLKGDRNG